jgi:hypothetical protein
MIRCYCTTAILFSQYYAVYPLVRPLSTRCFRSLRVPSRMHRQRTSGLPNNLVSIIDPILQTCYWCSTQLQYAGAVDLPCLPALMYGSAKHPPHEASLPSRSATIILALIGAVSQGGVRHAGSVGKFDPSSR